MKKFIKSLAKPVLLATAALSLTLPATFASADQPIEVYSELPRMQSVKVSPNGDRLAYVGPYKGSIAIFIYNLADPSQKAFVVPAPDDARVKSISWGSNKHVLYLATFNRSGQGKLQQFGNRYTRWISTNIETRETEIMLNDRVFSDEHVVGSRTASRRSLAHGGTFVSRLGDDPNHILMGYLEWNEKWRYRHYRVNLDSGKSRLERTLDGDTDDIALSPNGEKLLARSEYNGRTGGYRIFSSPDGGDEKQILSKSFNSSTNPNLSLIGVIPESGKILMFEDGQTEKDFFTLDPITGVRGIYDLQMNLGGGTYWPVFDEYNDALIGIGFEDDYETVQYSQEPYQSWQKKLTKAFSGKDVEIVSRTVDNSALTLAVKDKGAPVDYYLFEPNTNNASPLGSAYPELSKSDIGQTMRIDYEARDGRNIPGYLTLPPGKSKSDGPFSLVVMPHGGPAARDNAEFNFWSQAISDMGYAVFKPQFRGSTGFGVAHERAGNGEFGGAMLTDTVDGINYLAAENIINPDKICITGASYGGYQALALPMIEPGMFKCSVAVNGVSDIVEFLKFVSAASGSQQSYSIKYWNEVIGDYHSDRDAMRAQSPAHNADKIQAEVILFHGVDDLIVPLEQSKIMAKALKKSGQSTKVIELKGDDHNLSLAESRQTILEASEKLFRKHLK